MFHARGSPERLRNLTVAYYLRSAFEVVYLCAARFNDPQNFLGLLSML